MLPNETIGPFVAFGYWVAPLAGRRLCTDEGKQNKLIGRELI